MFALLNRYRYHVFFCIYLSNKLVHYDAHCTYMITFHRGKMINVNLQVLKVFAKFCTVVLTSPFNLRAFSVLSYK